jgi:hypothetical protein
MVSVPVQCNSSEGKVLFSDLLNITFAFNYDFENYLVLKYVYHLFGYR